MYHKLSFDYIIFCSSILTVVVFSHEANGILTDSNDLHCTHIQCPTKCPEDSYLKSSLDDEEDDFEDYEEELFGHDSYIEEIGHFEELPPEEELHNTHAPQHILKERQKREAFFQEDIDRCCDDQKCVCDKCADVPKCIEGHMAVEIHEGQGVPGNCCSVFKCVKKESCQLGVKQSWWTSKCTKCSCFGESEFCLQICPEEEILQNCYSEYWQKPMMNGAFWKEGRCTTCSCEQGDRRCLTPVCPKLDCKETIAIEDECCPKCVNEEIDVRPEIIDNKIKDIEDIAEGYSTESTTVDISVVKIKEDNISSNSQNHSSFPVVDENVLNETQTTSPITETIESSSASAIPNIIEEIASTFRTESVELFTKNLSSTGFTTSTPYYNLSSLLTTSSAIVTSTEDPTSIAEFVGDSTITTTTEGPTAITEYEHYSSPIYAYTEEPISIGTLEQDVSSAASIIEEVQTSSRPTTETPKEILAEDTTSVDKALTEPTKETSTIISTTFIGETAISEASTTSATATSISTTTVADAYTEVYNAFTTGAAPLASAVSFSTAVATETTNLAETTTTEAISTKPMTTDKEDSTSETSTPNYTTSTSILIKYSISSVTSTTSSPYSSTADSTTTSKLEESTYKSSTTAPAPLNPLFQSYGDFNTGEGVSNTQNQMRIMFDEIDYVVMIVLFMGSLLCISLGLIIRHTKNRKKMYSSIPNSETSLSQTSTNTVLTV